MLEFWSGAGKLLLGGMAFAAFLAWEASRPPRGRPRRRKQRWALNFTFMVLAALAVRVFAFLGPVALAVLAQSAGLGLFNAMDAPLWVAFPATLLALDLAMYIQHRLMHEWPPLWRFHRAHHTDPTLDVTSAFRFHPGEALASMLYKALFAVALGAPPLAVAVFEIWLMLAAMFTHLDVRLSPRLERALRWAIATPAVHEQHHDRRPDGQRRNYSSGLTLWDRLFGTWRRPSDDGVAQLGVHGVSDALAADIARGLFDPIANDAPYPPDR